MSPDFGSITTTEPALPAISRSAVSWMRRSTVVMTWAPGRGSPAASAGRAARGVDLDALAAVAPPQMLVEQIVLEPGLADHVAAAIPSAPSSARR